MMVAWIVWVVVVIVVVVALVAIYAVVTYNGFVRARNLIQESWRQIDVELNRRYDLIPNLVETVQGYAAHERGTLEQVTMLRGQAATLAQRSVDTPTEERAAVEQQLSGAVHNLLVSAEAYPTLQSNTNFLALQKELSDTEDRIANGRRYYNANVAAYNTKIESIPSNIVAGMAHLKRAAYFEVNSASAREAPRVEFGGSGQRRGTTFPEPTNEQLAASSGPWAPDASQDHPV